MENDNSSEVCEGVLVPAPAVLQRERKSSYGGVPGLDDEELADPAELEKQVIQAEFAPVLTLPQPKQTWAIRPDIDESGSIDWGAFGTIDFDRIRPEFDKARYRAEQLRRQLKCELIDMSIIKERLPSVAAHLVLKHLREGVLDLSHISDNDMLALAKAYLRSRGLRREIYEAEEASQRRRKAKAEAVLRSLD